MRLNAISLLEVDLEELVWSLKSPCDYLTLENDGLNPIKSIVVDTILAYDCTLTSNRYPVWVVATRQHSSNGKPKSPRVQVVLPEDLCDRLTALAAKESRTVSNMAKVLIQEGVNRLEAKEISKTENTTYISSTDKFRSSLESQQARRLKGAPTRIRLRRP